MNSKSDTPRTKWECKHSKQFESETIHSVIFDFTDCPWCRNEQLKRELAEANRIADSKTNVLKTLCEEWNDDCEPECDSVAHEPDCAATNMIEAMRKRRLRYEYAEQRSAEAEKIFKELDRARIKFPTWPSDIVHAAAIICEESGELIRAAIQNFAEDGSLEDCDKEAIQTAAMCLRFLQRK
jgi:hypothetical protein